jgi:hypothetical protein
VFADKRVKRNEWQRVFDDLDAITDAGSDGANDGIQYIMAAE